jgi:anaerobic selenocysteine-containing dehydrogenase
MSLGRRNFLTIAGATAAAAACTRPRVPERQPPPPQTAKGAKETWLATTCGACPGGCGLKARVVSGRLVGIAGNPLHPVNRGGLCALGAAGTQLLYHPDRVKTPLRRKGNRGLGQFEAVGWDQALSDIAGKLKGIGDPGSLALVDGSRGLAREAADRFARAFGTPNHLVFRPYGDSAAPDAIKAMQGIDGPVSYDLANARFILAFGPSWLDASSSPVGAARAYAHARRGRKGQRVRVVQIEPRLSVSAAHADEWVPIAAGTEGIFALGLLHMVLREGLEDRDFLDRWGNGFEALRGLVLRDYHPDAVSERTGVPVATIVRLAREFASTRPAIAIADDRPVCGSPSNPARMAVHALNALVGSVNGRGGVLVPPAAPVEPLPAIAAPTKPRAVLSGSDAAVLSAWLSGAGSYPIGALFAYRSDPLAASPARARELVSRLGLVVSFSSFLDETARYADYVLPEPTYLERWDYDTCATTRGQPVLGLRQPVVKARGDVRPAPETLAALAKLLSADLAAAVPFADSKEMAQRAVTSVHKASRGAVFDVGEAEPWVDMLERGGWRASSFGSVDEFWKALVQKGGWWDPVYDFGERRRVLRTASGRFDFEPLVKALTEGAPGDRAETISETVAAPDGFPLALYLFPLLAAYGDAQGPLPFVQDQLGREAEQRWSLWVELSPEDARKSGVKEGGAVVVESPHGAVVARARVVEGVHPGIAALPLGPGGAPGGTFGRALEARASDLLAPETGTSRKNAWVRIRRA